MRAAVFYGSGDIRIEQVPRPEPGSGELLLRVATAGVCGTDAHEFATGPHMFPIGGPHPVTGHQGPMVPGHEFTGTVVARGPDVHGFAEGESVVSGAGISCGGCHWCKLGRTNLCVDYCTVGLQRDGALAEYVAVPASTVVSAAPYELSPDSAALGQPMSIAVHAVRRGRLEAGEVAVVIGVGGIGAFLTYAVQELGAVAAVTDLDASRLDVAVALGANHVSMPGSGPQMSDVLAQQGLVPSVVYEVSGSPSGLRAALDLAAPGCRIVLVGLQGDSHPLNLLHISLREVEVIGTNAHAVGTDLPEALRLLSLREAGWSDVAPRALPLDRLVPDGLEPLAEHRSQAIKTLVDPWVDDPRDTVT